MSLPGSAWKTPSNPSNGRERVPRQRVNPSRTRPVSVSSLSPRRTGSVPSVPPVNPSKTGTGWSPIASVERVLSLIIQVLCRHGGKRSRRSMADSLSSWKHQRFISAFDRPNAPDSIGNEAGSDSDTAFHSASPSLILLLVSFFMNEIRCMGTRPVLRGFIIIAMEIRFPHLNSHITSLRIAQLLHHQATTPAVYGATVVSLHVELVHPIHLCKCAYARTAGVRHT
jgi:hypothetical protein